MPFKSREPQEIKDNEMYRIENITLSGKSLRYLIERSRMKNQGYGKYTSFLCENLIQEYAQRNPNPNVPNDLVNPKWSDQAEITKL